MNYPPMVYSHLSIHATWWNSREEEGRPLIGSANALSFHSRDWLFNYQSAQKTPG